MRLRLVMAPVARVHLLAAPEPEPAVAALVVCARAAAGQRLARVQAQFLLLSLWACCWGEGVHARGVGEELDVWDGEGEAGVAGVADVGGCCACDGEEGVGGWGGAVGACWEEGAGWGLIAGWERRERKRGEVPGKQVGCCAANCVDEACAG